MNSNMSAYASIFENIQNADDVGQSLECVIVVVGCDGTGSVGSSGDVIIGSGNNDTSNGGGGDDPLTCEECFEKHLSPFQLQIFLDTHPMSTLAEFCESIETNPETELARLEITLIGYADSTVVAELIACLEAALDL